LAGHFNVMGEKLRIMVNEIHEKMEEISQLANTKELLEHISG
jgi:hypothetical protein